MNIPKVKIQKTLSRRKTLFSEINQEFNRDQDNTNKIFNFEEFISKKECSAFNFGKEQIEQKCYICTKCDKKGLYFICGFCYENCHKKCRDFPKENLESLMKKEFLNLKRFSCYCGIKKKHFFEDIKELKKISCKNMELDKALGILPYQCDSHNQIVCCICAVVCHKKCKVEKIDAIDDELSCECCSDFHSNFNELALSFPLEQYKKVANIDIWPIQILNILFSTKTTFNNMSSFFYRILNNEIDINNNTKNVAIINKFEKLLELFSDSFNRKFKTYYYDEEMINIFPFENLFNFIKNFEVVNGQTAIIKFRLLFILLFMHLRKDFNTIKSFSSNDFYCNTVLERLIFKKVLRTDNIFSYNINEKYKLNEESDVKRFVLLGLCNLITKGMEFVSVEENQDEIEIGLKLIKFLLKRMIFDKNDIILLIDSIYDFHSNFYKYIMSEINNIYSLIDIFNSIVEICFIISIYYNDLVIEEYLNSKKINKISKFIHSKNEHSNKLLTILLKNCDLFSKHFHILIKPNLDKKSKEEIKREEKLRKHKLAMQNRILSRTTGVRTKMPENGGLFTDKIINLFIENLSIFSLADNIYQKQLDTITNEDINTYFSFCEKIKDENFYEIMNIEPEKHHSNVLYNLKVVLDGIFFELFTTSYVKQKEELEIKLRCCLLNSYDEISNNIDRFKNKLFYKKILYKFKKEEKEKKKNRNDYILNEAESLKRKILREISVTISFANNIFLLIDEGRELIVDNMIISQIDEILFKGMIFLTDIHYPNIISSDLIELFFHFLSLFLLTKRGISYIITGKNLQNIQRLINRFRYDEKNKNINEDKNRTLEFNINSIKIVIHFLNNLTKLIKIYNIKTIKGHKALMKFRKSILTHLKYFSYNVKDDTQEYEFKKQLNESLAIFNNLFPFYTYNEFDIIKNDIFDLFKNSHFKFLNSELFQKLFDKSIFYKDELYIKIRNCEISYYFQFFKLITKNSYYVYNNDEFGKKVISSILEFIDIQALEKIFSESSDMMSYTQKCILLKFIRTYYFIDYLDQVNYLNKKNPLSNKDYRYMINNNLIKDNKITQYLNLDITNNNKDKKSGYSKNNKENLKYIKNLEFINELITLFNIYGQEIDNFPYSIYNETNICIKNYIKELIFAIHEISNYIYYNKEIINKILPFYYKLVIKFLNRKEVFLKILKDISNNIQKIKSKNYEYLVVLENKNKDYNYIINNNFIIFNKNELFNLIIKNIYEIYNQTKINEDFSLKKYLEIYDIFNEANFPPFSLLEVKDYEYFYEVQDENESIDKINNEENKNNINNIPQNNNLMNKIEFIKSNFLEQFKNISLTSFLGILTGEATDKKFDFGFNFTELFESFINSSESGNLKQYRTLLCIMDKMLFYDGPHVQLLFKEMIVDKHFFKNLNRELNYYIVKYIESSKKYELCSICAEITDISKLTIQFLQLLGEGFNTDFHENILKEISEKRRIFKQKTLMRKGTLPLKDKIKDNDEEENSEDSDDENIIINDILIEKSIKFSVKQELNIIKNIPLVEPDFSIYQSMIKNLKIIFNIMELDNKIEGELAFDKLCILSTNIIDFLIEFIDTKQNLIDIIDDNIKDLFFSKRKKIKRKFNINDFKYKEQKGVYSIFTMKIKEINNENIKNENKDNNEDINENFDKKKFNKYKLRKTMLTYMKIKYFQLLKSYLQLGKKEEFIKLLLEHKLGPIQLFEEILYYMSELVNNLVIKNYDKYNYLLDINSVNSYKNKFKKLYMYEDDFRNSIEISLIFQICIIIKIMEETYGITMLKDHYDNESINNDIKNKKDKDIKNENTIENAFNENEDISDDKNNINRNLNIINDNINENKNNYNVLKTKYIQTEDNKITNNITNNISNTISPLKPKLPKLNNNLQSFNANSNDYLNLYTNDINKNIITLKENSRLRKLKKEEKINESLYQNIYKYYKKFILSKILKEKEMKLLQEKKEKLDTNNLNLKSIFSVSVYKFLFSLIQKVEIRSDIDYNTKNYRRRINYKRKCLFKICKEISQNIISFKNIDFFLSNRRANENYNIFENDLKKYYLNRHIKLLDEDLEENKITFFIKPYLSFHLSELSKTYFLNNVDRSSAKGKYKSLILFSDYFMFEMMFNMKFINKSKFLKKLSKISFYYIQVIYFILIIIENALLMYQYYRDYSLDYNEYNNINKSIKNEKSIDIIIILVIKLLINIFVFILWFYFKFILEFQRNIILKEEKSFIFRDSGKITQNINSPIITEYFQGNGSLLKTMELINKDLSFFNKLKISIFDSILFNLDINIFVFSFILNILFLIIGHPLILSFETLFIFGIFPSLLNIFKSFTAKFSNLFACLIFSYLLVYVYNWITIFYMRDIFDFGDILDYKSGQYIRESFCHSSMQCLLALISYGTRSGGGVGDVLPIISFKSDMKMFIWKFIYDIIFFIFIIMIMGNVTFGLIVDTFGELRDETYNYENDKKNICFICQLSRDGCLLQNIDFNKHIKEEHNLWNYVNFLIYLHLYNPNDFSRIEGIVWDKLFEKDLVWIPITDNIGEKEDSND